MLGIECTEDQMKISSPMCGRSGSSRRWICDVLEDRLTWQWIGLLWENMVDIEAISNSYWLCIRKKDAQHMDAHYRGGRRYGSFG
ncbi:hypothetical protein CDAR_299661 [Caerostris darwini]|uniref:Uncharacterized protein n=1 Tax=Caerostris darwini TaxID=1538125 RepID=A0AAV4RRW5_9ARAC|nr:hypothetical protein CDAR_299661 [Caerostris darwini]